METSYLLKVDDKLYKEIRKQAIDHDMTIGEFLLHCYIKFSKNKK